MNRELVDPIANAVLYEGYILYPYRPSTKNRNAGALAASIPARIANSRIVVRPGPSRPSAWCTGSLRTSFQVVVRFLHLTDRQVGASIRRFRVDRSPRAAVRPVEMLQVGTRRYHAWQEAEEREVRPAASLLGDLSPPRCVENSGSKAASAGSRSRGPPVTLSASLLRKQRSIEGLVEVAAAEVESGLFRMTIRTMNQTAAGRKSTTRPRCGPAA